MERFKELTDNYTFYDVSAQRECFNRGDILAFTKDNLRHIYIEVKDDSRIADTGNILCEESVYYYSTGKTVKGNFHSDYEIYCVVSQQERKIYVMDFNILKEHYKSGTNKMIYHSEQITNCYLCSLPQVRAWGAMIAELEY